MIRLMSYPAFISLLLCVAPVNSAARELKVPDEYQSIMDAMNSAVSGDIVIVSEGVYTENVFVKPGVALAGAGESKSILDGGGAGDVVILEDQSSIRGFTIKNSGMSEDAEEALQAGVRIVQATAYVTGNSIERNGAGIIMDQANESIIAGNVISHNGKYGIFIQRSRPKVLNNIISSNKPSAIFIKASSPVIINNTITSSETLVYAEASKPALKNNILSGAMHAIEIGEFPEDENYHPPEMANNLFWDNRQDYVNTKAGVGDINADPKFVSLIENNYHLKPGSPAIDSANQVSSVADQDGSMPDIGAYGGHGMASDPEIYKSHTSGAQGAQWLSQASKDNEANADTWNTTASPIDLKKAGKDYKLHCSPCHGEKGDGKGVLAESLGEGVSPRDHTDSSIMSLQRDADILKVISEGGPSTGVDAAMPAFNTILSQNEIENLVKYIRHLCKCQFTTP